MLKYDAIIIGFGKAGKTLAGELGNRGWKVAMIEKDPKMYGGTCINIACIPTKVLVHDGLHNVPYSEAINRKDSVVEKLRKKNYKKLADHDNVVIYESAAKFISDKEVEIEIAGKKEVLTAEHIFINTGAQSNIPPLEGDIKSDKVYTSTTLIDRKELPEQLAIVGAGYIGLEYASMYQSYGSKVTVISPDEELIPQEDQEIRTEVKKVLEEKGIRFILGAKAEKIKEADHDKVTLTLSNEEQLDANAVLLATGRKPNVENLGLENTAIKLTEDGAIKVDEHLETTVGNVFALGDVKGGMQFTYISLDDYRIVVDYLFGNKEYSLKTRKNVPYSVFIDPPLSRVGLTAKEAKEKGYEIAEGKLAVASHPRAHVINDLRGLFKVVIDKRTNQILGASLFGPESPELINLVKLAMDLEAPYTYLRDQIYNHPVMSESFNNLFAIDK
ncbi:FAD-containing oxidoreductase [Oceanobacillus piezotolerans]|uniref:FAD-containing oxidoreductase n=1 Tax=Oceanobacillus piezotolerans TaxID=2448030 RepID=A0A498D566_9BACI|nr:FAD-containing oxidoreductase [Oceanobacillus piezotolerans]RLL41311.1 FAD-containing oxidoreductase [Oceanobacillus piezotolerans]